MIFWIAMGEGSFEQNPFAPPSEEADFQVRYDEPEGGHQLATYGQRWAGSVLDSLLYLPLTLAGLLLGVLIDKNQFEAMAIALGALGFIVMAAYQWYLVSTTGQSLAKRWLRMRIVREDGSLPGFLHGVVLRVWVIALAGLIPFIGSFVGLGDCIAIFMGNRRQTLHDRLAGTLVVQV